MFILFPFTDNALSILRDSISFLSPANNYYRTGVGALVKCVSPDTEYQQLNVHLCGDSRAGKTTLRKSLYHCIRNFVGPISLPSTSVTELDTLESTIGLEKESVSKNFGGKEFVLFDYGGQDEYHVNHSPHLASGPDSVYVVVVGLAEVDQDNKVRVRGQQDEAECLRLVERYEYWLRFINSVASPDSLVVTVLNFQSVASAAFCDAVQQEISKLQEQVKRDKRLRNLRFWKDVIIGDLFKTSQVYASSLFKEMENAVTHCSPSVVTGGVAAVRRLKGESSRWPRVVALDEFKQKYVLTALLKVSDVSAAQSRLSTEDWNLLESTLLTETVKDLRRNGDILEVFNWFTSNVLGQLFRGGWGKTSPDSLSSVFDFAMTSHDIEEVVRLRHNFDGDVDALPELLAKLHVCKQMQRPGETEKYWFPAFQPVRRPSEVEFWMHEPVRVVRRRFCLNDDYIFPPGYFAELYMKMTELDPSNHEFGFWENSMKFETLYEEKGTEYQLGVYITLEPSKYFDVVVCSTNAGDKIVFGRRENSYRVWAWLNLVRYYVYSIYDEKFAHLVSEWCLDPVRDCSVPKAFQGAFNGRKNESNSNTLLRRFYYGTCLDKTSVEYDDLIGPEHDVFRILESCQRSNEN